MRVSFLILGVMIMLTVPIWASFISNETYEADDEFESFEVDPEILKSLRYVFNYVENFKENSNCSNLKKNQSIFDRKLLTMTYIPRLKSTVTVTTGKSESEEYLFLKNSNGEQRILIKCPTRRETSSDEG